VARSWSTQKTHQLGHVGVAITFGLVIMFGIYAVGHISGAHFNPAVTFGFALSRHFPWQRATGYWIAQAAGAVAAALLLRGSLGNVAYLGATSPSGSQGQAFLWEAVLSFFLMFVMQLPSFAQLIRASRMSTSSAKNAAAARVTAGAIGAHRHRPVLGLRPRCSSSRHRVEPRRRRSPPRL
jgi:aquaporin NIP